MKQSVMVSGNSLAEVAALVGDPTRATILAALMDGRALTAGELAYRAGVTAQTTSGHLARLSAAKLLVVEKQGRHRYHRLASAEVARAIEGLMALAAAGPARHRPVGPRDAALRTARTCYDHLAGRLGVALSDALCARGHVVLAEEGGAASVTDSGAAFLDTFGIALPGGGKRPACRACLDWSERRAHLAGRLGAALCEGAFARGWIARLPDSRAVRITQAGRAGFAATFGIACEALGSPQSVVARAS